MRRIDGRSATEWTRIVWKQADKLTGYSNGSMEADGALGRVLVVEMEISEQV